MKKILAIAAVAALSAGVSAYAANPFSDVTPNDWAYQAVESLSEQGVVEGYPDGTFKGERNITRYEMAQIIARMLAKEDQLNAEQRATLDRLAGEYADELANLGVRVSNLEKKVGNLAWSGDARMQYQRNIDSDNAKSDAWTGRMRINVSGQVNDEVSVNGRLVSEMDFKDSDDKDVTMDRIFALWTPNDATHVSIGRQGVALDQTGVFWDEDGIYDGISAGWDNGSFGIEGGYGYLTSAAENYAVGDDEDSSNFYGAKKDTENWYAKLTGHLGGRADVSAFYLKPTHKLNGDKAKEWGAAGAKANVWGAGTSIDLGGNFALDGDYVQTRLNHGLGHAALWTAGLTYGAVDVEKPGTWTLGVHYVDADWGSYALGNSALDLTDQLDYGMENGADVKFWVARAGVAVQKNVELDAYYNFAGKADGAFNNKVDDPDDAWGVELNYSF
ncbi:S-layer homology domain-containing protein [uncultured Dialister sp.]|jgi:hypothetical protein|uniref:S-layer homology domain-containing protein n=1 Tax=Dialister hominis TaxID=2582419 RepID=UPI0026709E49|nr:S-layer homology domain-containing protein [uncultured Dialister sp.]